MYGYIYLTENLENGKCYIGQHKNKCVDRQYKGSGNALKLAFKKYGRANFVTTLVEECDTRELLNEREKYWIEHCNAQKSVFFYNINSGGESDFGCTDETKAKISNKNKGKNNGMYGKHHTLDARKRISVNNGMTHNKEAKERMIAKLKGRVFTKERNKKVSEHFKKCHYYNNGVINKFCIECPDGFVKGRIRNW